nr:hypothetical protein [Variovorax sp. S12S4]
MERVGRIGLQPVERGGRIDVPEHDARARALQVEHGLFEQRVEHAHAAGLDHQVGAACMLDHAACIGVALARIHDDLRPVRIFHVAVLLAAEGIGLVEAHAVASLVQRTNHAAVIGGGAVPVGGHEAGGKEGDVHLFLHAGMLRRWVGSSSSSA